jgi:type III secretory pathway component EscS
MNRIIINKFVGLLVLLFAGAAGLQAQELNARVTVNSDRIQTTNKIVFTSMERALNQFINGTQWSSVTFSSGERIDCTFSVTILEQLSDNTFRAELFVQSRRPVYNSSYTTTLLNYREPSFEFEYTENAVFQMQQNTLNSNLEAIFVFYAYMILALDFDSFSPLGGSVFYRQAQSIATLAQSYSGWNGWSALDNRKNRGAIVNAFLDETLKGYRDLWYTYHRKGLDEMAANADRGRTTVLNALPVLKEIRQVRSSEVILQMFADSKLDEIVSIAGKASQEEKKDLYDLLRNIFPSVSNQLESLKK